MLDPAAAEAAIRSHVRLLPSEHRPLSALHGAVLREPLIASRDQPPFHRVTMDGIACSSQAVVDGQRRFRIVGTQAAGSAPLRWTDPQTCFEVMTGAVAPEGCDCVIPIERLTVENGVATLNDDVTVSVWLNIHTRGLDARAGQVLLEPGARIGPTAIALAANAGLQRICVSRAPRIAIISTGNELVEPGTPVEDWQVYRSNAYAIASALRSRGYDQLTDAHLPDDLEVQRTQLAAYLKSHDVLILSGGVSKGRFDYVPQVLSELGVRRVFHGVAQRPGKPFWFGVSDAGTAVYALPGNPVSVAACLARYVYSGLDVALGTTPTPPADVVLQSDYEVRPKLTLFLPVELHTDSEARQWAKPRPTQGSGDFISLLGTHGFVEMPPGPRLIERGTRLPFYAW
jgi:molybdopterin molybdotransferase